MYSTTYNLLTGKNLSKSRKKFWSYFSDIVNRKYDQDLFQAYDKYNLINKFLINEKDAVKVEVHNRLIYTIQLKNISQNIHFLEEDGVCLLRCIQNLLMI